MGSKETAFKKSDPQCNTRNLMESSENSAKEDKMMDFESGIDTWVIDKEDSNGSCFGINEPEAKLASMTTKRTMDKENITRSSTNKNSLRCFRIRKDVSYKELSSESENESKLKVSSCYESTLSNVSTKNMLSTSLSDMKCTTRDRERLNSGEITLYLSELNSSSDSNNEKGREHLQSIENVASISESNVTDENISPTILKINGNVLCSSSEFNCTEEFITNEDRSKRISSISDNLEPNQKNDRFSFDSSSLKSKPEFLDTYKTHLTNQFLNSENRNKSILIKSSDRRIKNSDKYPPSNQQLFKCNVCSYYCSDLLLHKSHLILFHSDKKILDCEYCDYQTYQCANLASHIRIHFQLECPYCDYRCPGKKSLESHLLVNHGGKSDYKCNKCNFICKSQVKFEKHSQTHSALGKYKCSDCSLDFENKKTLKTHVKKHLTKEKKFKCLSCHLSFCKKQQLKIHLRSHEKSYVCDICNFKCIYKHKLEIHMKVHTRKSLKCGKCNSIFSRKSNLKLHMRVHFANSKCQYCPFLSSDPNELSKHICIKNLYDVQKCTLNFESGNDANCEYEKTNDERNGLRSNSTSTAITCAKRPKGPIEKAIDSYVPTKSAPQRKKQKPNRRRLSSLRSHLPSRTDEKSVNNKDEEVSDKGKPVYKTRNSFKQSTWEVDQIGVVGAQENHECRKRIKYDHLQSIGLNCPNTSFNNKLIPKEILFEPVRLTNGSYIQCFYQSQPSINNMSNHMERHIRQSTLLSCRFCNYKTNSSRLLQCHTSKKHTWDPAVVSMLFS